MTMKSEKICPSCGKPVGQPYGERCTTTRMHKAKSVFNGDIERLSFEERWAEIEPLYYLTGDQRLTLTQIGHKLGIGASQVSRVAREARDRGLVDRRNAAPRRSPYKGISYGSMPAAMLPTAQANPEFRNWIIVQTATSGVTVCELAISALLDTYYEETQTD